MLALMEMTNPMWEWFLAPLILFTLGYCVGWAAGMYEKRSVIRANSYKLYLQMLAEASKKGENINDV